MSARSRFFVRLFQNKVFFENFKLRGLFSTWAGLPPAVQAAAHIQKLSGLLGVPAAIAGRRSATRQVAVLAVNVASLLELLGVSNEVLAAQAVRWADAIRHADFDSWRWWTAFLWI